MNNKIKLFRAITGYAGPGACYSSAHDEYYYSLSERTEKLEHLRAYAENWFNIYTLTDADIESVCDAIEIEHPGTAGWDTAEEALQ